MDPLQRLGITKINDDDIHSALERFSMKWEDKAGHAGTDRVSRR